MVLQRLLNQHLLRPRFRTPHDEVRWLVAVQAQDYPAARWAVGLRLKDAVDPDIERAYDEGTILRTHVLRPTLHFVAPGDIRWLLQLTGPRVTATNASICRALGLDERTFKRSQRLFEKALGGRRALTRLELQSALVGAGIDASDTRRLAYLVMRAEVDGLICSGPRRGRQFTYMLLEERVPPAEPRTRNEALGELATRYFTSHGPATVRDFAKWSGQTLSDARRGVEVMGRTVPHESRDGDTYWGTVSTRGTRLPSPIVHLLSIYDEYLIGYKDYSPMCDRAYGARLVGLGNALQFTVLIDGRIAGTWRRTLGRHDVEIETTMFRRLTPAERRALTAAAEKYGRFTGRRAAVRPRGAR